MFEVFADGESRAHSDLDTLCALDERYARGDAALISPQLGFTFDYDATKPIAMGRNAVAAGEIPPFTSRPIEQCAMGERVPGRLVAQGVYCEREGAKSLGQRMQYAYLSFRSAGRWKRTACSRATRARVSIWCTISGATRSA